MKFIISKKPIGSLLLFLKPKSRKIRVSLIIFSSLALFSVFPYFAGPGLSESKPMNAYLNGAFQPTLFQDNGLYRPAFPNLTFIIPIVFETVPNQNRIIVGELPGMIYWFDNDETTTEKTEVLDLTSQVGIVWDGGLLGATFHPRFDDPENPANYLFVFYSSKDRNGGNMPVEYNTQGCTDDSEYGSFLILERYTVDPETLVADPSSRTKLIVNKLFGDTHRGGGMTFGDDGFLYLTTGDQSGWSKSQDIINGLDGGVLRLDVDMQGGNISHPPIRRLQDNLIPGVNYNSDWFINNAGPHPSDGNGVFYTNQYSGVNYYIPNDNPFCDNTPGSQTNLYGQLNLETSDPTDVYQPGDFYEEYYTIGNRSPHRLFKDSDTGDLYIGEVGLSTHEEINVVVPGANFGWPIYEGNDPRPGSPCSSMFNNMPHELPLTEFARADANSITGGFVYRGTDNPELFGKYICADYGISDEIFAVDITTGDYEILGAFGPENIISWGQDYNGELYILRQGDFTEINGDFVPVPTTLYRLTTVTDQYDLMPQTLSQTGAFEVSGNGLFEGAFSDLTPTEGIVPYELIESFWSDGAYKKRWLAIPNGGDGIHDGPNEQINYTENGDWDFPIGTVLIKHFELNTDRTNPSQRKKIETRFSIKGEDGNFYFLTYNWNDDETDAILQEVGLEEDIEITTAPGVTETQTWLFPSQSQCLACHNQANKGGLGLKARYLNSDYLYDDNGTPTVANQLVTLSSIGILDSQITDAQTPNIQTHKAIADDNASIDERARSYLDLNCAYCHRPDNVDNRGQFDLRRFNTIQETGLLTANILSPLNIAPDEEILFQGDATKSILFHRLVSTDPNIMMPPLAKTLVDQPAVDLIQTWINELEACFIRNIEEATQGACQQSTNTYTQDLIITYANAPATGTLEVNGQSFPITASPQTVTLTNLVADGGPVNVTAFFSDDPDCTFTIENVFTAPLGCSSTGPLTGLPDNVPDNMVNLGLVTDAELAFVTNTPVRGAPDHILFDPVENNYFIPNEYNEFGEAFESNIGTVDEENGFEWRVNWDNPKYINYITFGGAYPDQPQPNTMWKISYFFNGNWITLAEGQGGWIDSGIFEWGGTDRIPIIAEALRIRAFSDGENPVESFHLRARGGIAGCCGQNPIDDSATSPKATLIQYLPLDSSCGLNIGIDDYLYCNNTWKDGNEPNETTTTRNVYVGNGTYVVAEDQAIEVNNLEVSVGAKVIVEQGGSIKVNGDLISNGVIELLSTSNKYSSIVVDGTSIGSITYKRHINAFDSNDLIASPLKGVTFGIFSNENENIFENPSNPNQKLFGPFNESAGTYEIYSIPEDNTQSLISGKGYRTARDSSEDGINGTTFTFKGQVETEPIDVSITKSGSSFDGWNLIGNPYPSYLSLSEFLTTNNDKFDIASAGIYGYDGVASDGWTIWNQSHADANTEELIAPGQGFFVRAKSDGETVTFTPSMQRTGNADDFILGRNTQSAHFGFVRLEADAQSQTFTTDFYFNSNASTGLDPGYDASLFGGTAPPYAIYSHLVENNTGMPYAIQALGSSDMSDITIPLGLNASQGQNITIRIAQTDLPDSINIYLEDTLTGTITLLNTNEYSFTPSQDLSGAGRFFLTFESSALSLEDNPLSELTVISNPETKSIDILGLVSLETDFNLYDLHGRLVIEQKLDTNATFNSVNVSNLTTGVYIIELKGQGNQKLIKKVIVR
jgi:uncharacterized repeat protein (TIGR03806 family)